MSVFSNLSAWLEGKSLGTKLLLLIALIIFISGIYWYFFWSPNNKKLQSLQRTLSTRKTKLAELQNIEKKLPEFEKEFARLNKEFEISSLKLPKNEEIPALIDSVYSEVSASGLEPIEFSKLNPVNKSIYAEIPIDMNVSGSFFEIATFFDRVARLPRIVNIRDIKLEESRNRRRGESVEGELDAEFTAVTFRLLETAQTTQAPGKDKLKR